MLEPTLVAVEEAARREDPVAFDRAFESLTATCNECHRAEQVAFVHVVPPPVRASIVRRPPTSATTVLVVRHAQALKNVRIPRGSPSPSWTR